jgi:transcriptional antiterminator NusG
MSVDVQNHQWYVVRVFSGHEKKIQAYLQDEIQELGLEDKIKEVLVPTETVLVIKAGKKKKQEKNFFPGYILLNTTYDSEVNDLIQSTPSCMGFLIVDGQKTPQPLKKHEVNDILSRVRAEEDIDETQVVVDIKYKEGDLVKVIDGPFKEFDGTLERLSKP